MTDTPPSPPADDVPEQMQVRRDKRQRLLDRGVQPYPIEVERTHTIRQVRATFDARELEPCISRRFHIAHDKLQRAFHRVDEELTQCVRAIEAGYLAPQYTETHR